MLTSLLALLMFTSLFFTLYQSERTMTKRFRCYSQTAEPVRPPDSQPVAETDAAPALASRVPDIDLTIL